MNWKNKNAHNYKIGTFSNDDKIRELIRQDGKEWREKQERTMWDYLLCNIIPKNWNPETMKKVIERECKADGFVFNFKWPALTADQHNNEIQYITKNVNAFIDEMNLRESQRQK